MFSECEKFFSRPWRLKIHISHIHTGERAFKCQVEGCEKSYVRNSHLRRHYEINHSKAATQQKISTPENKFPCIHCQKLFSNKYSLKKHQKVILWIYFSLSFLRKINFPLLEDIFNKIEIEQLFQVMNLYFSGTTWKW